jgi:hypothetical protein
MKLRKDINLYLIENFQVPNTNNSNHVVQKNKAKVRQTHLNTIGTQWLHNGHCCGYTITFKILKKITRFFNCY